MIPHSRMAWVACALALLLGEAAAASDTVASRAPTRTAIVGVRIHADAQSRTIERGTILIDGDRIRAVTRATRAPRDYVFVDGSGLTAVAGYWNSHVHLAAPELFAKTGTADATIADYFGRHYLAYGFTTVVDLASETSLATAISARIETRRLNASRVLTAGSPFYPPGGTPIYARPIYQSMGLPTAEIVDGAQAAERVRAQADAGAHAIKIFTGAIVGGADAVVPMSVADAKAIVAAAHARNLPAFAHPTNAAGLDVAVQAGVDVLAHVAPLAGEWSPEYAESLVARRIALTPTLRLFELFPAPETPVEVAVQQARALFLARGDLLFGTDAGFSPEFDPRGEWRLMARFMDWRDILAAMTSTPARRFGEVRERGRLAGGMVADIVLLAGDPARDVENFSKVVAVFRSGRVVYGGAATKTGAARAN